eukprot:12454097-Alexandrium_andersonii.AAC.1
MVQPTGLPLSAGRGLHQQGDRTLRPEASHPQPARSLEGGLASHHALRNHGLRAPHDLGEHLRVAGGQLESAGRKQLQRGASPTL